MKLPSAEHAVVDIAKLRAYCLNPLHRRGRHKAYVFASTPGIRFEDADFLRDRVSTAVKLYVLLD